MTLSLSKRIYNKFNQIVRNIMNRARRKKLQNTHFSVLSHNCTGGFMLHDLGLQFRSPFVNLYLSPEDFIRYLKNIEHYRQQSLEFINEKDYPVAKLDDLTLYFMHYHSEQEAEQKWHERTARIDMNNLFVIMTERDGCTYQDMQEFDALPFPNKVLFTHRTYPDIKSSFMIKGFENQTDVGDLYEYTGFNGERYYDQFDFVSWFNQTK
ncbi:DUF1919 domain-containing protein [Mannheimia sp. AT1]|uniref:DUF1919 domain-containing protein n=1 Tax=Mannheimia cairinae TaxID=3025936 RepID=A0ABT5MRZ4_9PAST|nr:DUF1919 domain-containing protein [Mannheimia cairinae]MDD0824950.1 DUF1919 domain-containing protein [Mannheimia cairinae]MDD0826120.1 DUF1919 domain-containing protein [Mannheimia cairinae]